MLAASLYLDVTDDRRAVERPTLEREGTIRSSELAQPIAIHDLTRDGCRITTSAAFAVDDVVGVGIGGVGVTQARIAWVKGDDYGCAFLQPLQPGRVTAAFEASNLVAFPTTDPRAWAATMGDPPLRWTPFTTAVVVSIAGIMCWTVIGAAVLALI